VASRAARGAAGIPGHSGGSAPDSHRLPFTTDRMNVSDATARRSAAAPAPSDRRSPDGR